MPRYQIDSKATELAVVAKSSLHDTKTVWSGISGHVEVDVDQIDTASAHIEVDMTTADAGDWLKNRKLRKDMDFASHPKAIFELSSIELSNRDGDKVDASIHGKVRWRGKEVEITAKGGGTVTDTAITAQGSFAVDVTKFGIKPPKVLMFKIDDVVEGQIKLAAKLA